MLRIFLFLSSEHLKLTNDDDDDDDNHNDIVLVCCVKRVVPSAKVPGGSNCCPELESVCCRVRVSSNTMGFASVKVDGMKGVKHNRENDALRRREGKRMNVHRRVATLSVRRRNTVMVMPLGLEENIPRARIERDSMARSARQEKRRHSKRSDGR